FTFESTHRTKDGREYPVEISANYLALNGMEYNCSFARNIYGRKQVEEKIKSQNEFLINVIESLPYPFYVVDALSYEILLANSKTAPLYKWKGATCYSLTHHRETPCDSREHTCPLLEVRRTHKPVVLEHIHFDYDGNKRNVEVHGYPIFGEDGELLHMIEYAIDISQRRIVEEEKEELISKLQEALEKVKLLRGLIPICASCKKIRDDKGYWKQIESYIRDHSEAEFTHSICPDCYKQQMEELEKFFSSK
ncbi:MAG: PAS domain-containing protein, partial [Deltaproteobacteria bacterium]|nr:PAS domain-containing protein [Deltaproteobacteria bacterium]